MRALTAKCIIVALVAIPATAHAQLSGLFGTKTIPARQQRVVHAPSARQIQFQEVLPAVPSATTEAAPLPADTAPAFGSVPVLEAPMPPHGPVKAEVTYGGLDAPVEIPAVERGTTMPESSHGETIDEFGIGQSYDIPISDVIPEQSAEIYSTNNWFRGGRWYSKQEFMMLLRTDLPLVHIAVDASQGSADPFLVGALSSKDADFTYEAGTRLSIGKILGRDVANRDHSMEISFMGLFDYTGRARIEEVNPSFASGAGVVSLLGSQEANSTISSNNALGILSFGFPIVNAVPGFNRSRSQEILYEADLNSFEVNYAIGARPARDRMVMQPDGRWVRHATPSRIKSMYIGFRYIRQNESFTYSSVGGRNRVELDTGETRFFEEIDDSGLYRVTTDNDLFGVQIGGETLHKRTDWVFGLNGRIGGLINFADRHSSSVQTFDGDNSPGVILVTETASQSLNDETLTFLTEASAFVSYYVRPNTSFRLGYNVLYMNGLATATNNIGLMPSFPKFELTGDSLYHGMNFGFEMTW